MAGGVIEEGLLEERDWNKMGPSPHPPWVSGRGGSLSTAPVLMGGKLNNTPTPTPPAGYLSSAASLPFSGRYSNGNLATVGRGPFHGPLPALSQPPPACLLPVWALANQQGGQAAEPYNWLILQRALPESHLLQRCPPLAGKAAAAWRLLHSPGPRRG